ncbi:Crp/Fnr family transcriptional regulator [Flagellimonas onchidii]|uniref:Crp/Fnr family transcriptional regulator n=1 Tax=Flagellimonas onchidii TaxID=2562684 RepID=UPI0010A662E0|nr:Crp/Fnr family transcriptional regulator [Allomuricauda onchidii]
MGKCTEIQAHQLRNFKSLSKKALDKVVKTSEQLFLPKGSIVFEENQHLNRLYCIKEGACKFSTLDNLGQEHILRFLGEGEVMGKRSLVSNKGAKVSATTLTDTVLCSFDKNEILQNLKTNADFCNDLLNAFVEDISINEHTRIIFCTHNGIKKRLASLLLYLADKFGQEPNGKLFIRLKREDMAAVLGTSQEYVVNLLTYFKRKKLIKIERSEVFIVSKRGLNEMILKN